MSETKTWVVVTVTDDGQPDDIIGPFESDRDAEKWALAQPNGERFWRQTLVEPYHWRSSP